MPIVEALDLIAAGRAGRMGGGLGRRAALGREIAARVRSGSTLAGAMDGLPDVVPPAHAALIGAGEKSGTLEQALARVVEEVDRRTELRREIWRRAAYPLTCLVAAVVLLPVPAMIVGGTASLAVFQACVLGLLLAAALLFWNGARWFPKGSPLRGAGERFLLRSRVLGSFFLEPAAGRAFALLGELYESGLPLAQSIPLVARAAAWEELEGELLAIEPRLRQGSTLAEALAAAPLLAGDPGWIARIAVGEKAGSAGRALRELGLYIEESAHRRALAAVKVLPIVLLFIVAAFVLVMGLKLVPQLYSPK